MTYILTRSQGMAESRVKDLEATTVVHLMQDWSITYPTECITIRDHEDAVVAYRLPRAVVPAS
jgi:hypothetical protein